jgi:hypothetical protein
LKESALKSPPTAIIGRLGGAVHRITLEVALLGAYVSALVQLTNLVNLRFSVDARLNRVELVIGAEGRRHFLMVWLDDVLEKILGEPQGVAGGQAGGRPRQRVEGLGGEDAVRRVAQGQASRTHAPPLSQRSSKRGA